MSNSVAPAVKTANDEIPWNPKVRQKKQPADYVVDFLIGLLVVAVVIVVLYPLWFIVIASFSNASLVSQGGVTLFPKGSTSRVMPRSLMMRESGPVTRTPSSTPWSAPSSTCWSHSRWHSRFPAVSSKLVA